MNNSVVNVLNTKVAMVAAVAVTVAIAFYFLEKRDREVAKKAAAAFDPTSSDNIFASGVDSVGEILTGDDNFSLGGWVYDKIHGVGA
jgi:hypothetical protein